MKIKRVKIISATPFRDEKPYYATRIGEETWVIDDNVMFYEKYVNPECDENGVQTGLMIQVDDFEVLQEIELL